MVGENKTHLTETDIFTKYLLPAVKTAGWDVMSQVRQEVKLRDGKNCSPWQTGLTYGRNAMAILL